MFEAHFGVPMSGAVLNTINTRLDADAMAFIFQHAQSKVVQVDREFGAVVRKALSLIDSQPLVIAIDDPLYREGELVGELDYEGFIALGDGDEPGWLPVDEWQAISLNYTSGTTGNPKGVVYHHRGAHLNAVSNALSWELPCAFVKLKEGRELTQAELIAFCREQMAHFKAPKRIIFTPLPKTSTGKVQKFMLRKQLA